MLLSRSRSDRGVARSFGVLSAFAAAALLLHGTAAHAQIPSNVTMYFQNTNGINRVDADTSTVTPLVTQITDPNSDD